MSAAAERLSIEFREADAEALPFPDDSFDVVVSTFGVMFTADQDRAASELVPVCKRGGKIGLANWTPDGFIGQLFKTIGKHVPPRPRPRPLSRATSKHSSPNSIAPGTIRWSCPVSILKLSSLGAEACPVARSNDV